MTCATCTFIRCLSWVVLVEKLEKKTVELQREVSKEKRLTAFVA